ncbi:formate dehydrogenase accessory sulfurtransferase FdhD [Cellulomonas sp. S1-8]|uniref:formate dehydrogenase accessory sulfurtransferase FdhD n=1 Tax=Cellulomonas sp. S1-8 TaxID=2904790 RepID=UPI00224439E4|nr:formate dehydrogenase accessory sulfurtransferase FdhD [Cellulomonas sp. S1-8]UZN01707.1 formate dehydrogenase accessory sulfurtransferase FdhD [Cellulomonas sp. S1-8]
MRVTKRWRVQRMAASGPVGERADVLAGEEPLEIRIHGEAFTVTMRTPGNDVDLVAGFLVSEGVVRAAQDIASIGYRGGVTPTGERDLNVVDVHLAPGVALPARSLERYVYTSSSCGVCGTASIDAVRKDGAHDLTADDAGVRLDHLLALPDRLREQQVVFGRTGGVHAAALFLPSPTGEPRLACLREDVGRHNAVDKVVGWALREGLLPLRGSVLQLSGRVSFELVQKAAMAGVPVVSAVSAPSALAVELGDELGVTVVGFNRGETLNAYTHVHRLHAAVPGTPRGAPLTGRPSVPN